MSGDPISFGDIVDLRAEKDPDRLVFVFENGDLPPEQVRAGDLAARGTAIAARLHRDGFVRGDRLAVLMRNHPEFLYTLVAASRLGLVAVPVDPRARREKLRYFLAFPDAKGVVVADYTLAEDGIADDIEAAGAAIYAVPTPEGAKQRVDVSGRTVLPTDGEAADAGRAVDSADAPWLLSYTSGTTGDPKAIVVPYSRLPFYARNAEFFGYRSDDVPYTGLSLVHGNALFVSMLPALLGQVDHTVFSRWFTKSRLWDVCRAYGCTTWSNLGGIATAVYGEPPSPHDRVHPVRLVLSAGMPPELWRPFEERFGVTVLEWYGTMEGAFAYNPPGTGPIGSFGKPPAGVFEMDIVDEEGGPVASGEVGELVARPAGRPAQLEYFRNPEASSAKIRNGWLLTGDMCHRDEDGWLYFSHRKEAGGIRRLGEFVSVGSIQRVVAEHPDVLDVHVYGVSAATGAPGESDVVVAVVPRDQATFRPEELLERCVEHLEPSHVPDVVQIVDELPKTPTQKVQERFLEALLDATDASVYRK
jgi:acyl-coenzyme A synthetase/AMP-(fatty) acid ligase